MPTPSAARLDLVSTHQSTIPAIHDGTQASSPYGSRVRCAIRGGRQLPSRSGAGDELRNSNDQSKHAEDCTGEGYILLPEEISTEE
jgi:hypothetical protein